MAADATPGGTGAHRALRGGRQAVMERVLDAGEELFATHPYRNVSVRQLADAAGVSHALVHRYFGSKFEVLRAVVQRAEGDLVAGAREATTVQDAVAAMLAPERMSHNRRYFMLMMRLVMGHMLPEAKPDGFPASTLLVDIARRQSEAVGGRVAELDPAFVAAAVVAMVLGFVTLEEPLLRIAGMSDAEPAQTDERLRTAVRVFLDAALPRA